jgi:hypothetical protein
MRRNILFTLILFFLTFILFTACSKKNDPNVSKTDMLVAQEWKGDQVMVNGIDVAGRQEVIAEIGQIKTVRIKFDKNGSYKATYTNNQGDQTETGTWAFNDNQTMMTFDLYGEVTVVRLTNKNLDFLDKIPFQGTMFDAEVKFIK